MSLAAARRAPLAPATYYTIDVQANCIVDDTRCLVGVYTTPREEIRRKKRLSQATTWGHERRDVTSTDIVVHQVQVNNKCTQVVVVPSRQPLKYTLNLYTTRCQRDSKTVEGNQVPMKLRHFVKIHVSFYNSTVGTMSSRTVNPKVAFSHVHAYCVKTRLLGRCVSTLVAIILAHKLVTILGTVGCMTSRI